MTKLEQMQERAREKYPNLVSVIPAHWSNPDEEGTKTAIPKQETPVDLNSLITEVWNEAIKECEGCVPDEEKPKGKLYINGREADLKLHSDIAVGFNECRNQTLQAIRSKLRVI